MLFVCGVAVATLSTTLDPLGASITLSASHACAYDAVNATASYGDARPGPDGSPLWLRIIAVRSERQVAQIELGVSANPPAAPSTLRLAQPGSYLISIVDADAAHTYASMPLEVRECAGDIVVARDEYAAEPETPPPQPEPVLALRGVLATDGGRPFLIPNDVVEAAAAAGSDAERGAWSLALWLNILPNPLDGSVFEAKHRVLFYKGKGNDDRTPTVAILSGTNRFRTMVSTSDEADLGATSVRDLIAGNWLHVAFAFDNFTARAEGSACPPTGCYSIRIYTDGTLDSELTFSALPRWNDGDLRIGDAPGIDGVRALIVNATLLPIALDAVSAAHAASGRGVSGRRPRSSTATAQQQQLTSLAVHSSSSSTCPAELDVAATLGRALDLLSLCGGDVDDVHAALATMTVASDDDVVDPLRPGLAAMRRAAQLLECAAASADASKPQRAEARGILGRALLLGGYGIGVGGSRCTLSREMPRAMELIRAASNAGRAASATLLAHATVAGAAAVRRAVRPAAGSSAALLRVADAADEREADAAALALYQRAAALGDPESCLALGFRYQTGRAVLDVATQHRVTTAGEARSAGVADLVLVPAAAAEASTHCELGAFYYRRAAEEVGAQFHATGQQPLSERQVLNERTAPTVDQGERGGEDERLVYQQLRAEEGDIASMIGLGSIYYYGARGMARDQVQAFRWFERAARLGDPVGQAAAADLLMKGEGIVKNATEAVVWYQKAADQGSIRGLNGLGFANYRGIGIDGAPTPNYTAALMYFEEAAEQGSDSDSLWNAGKMHLDGLGGENASAARGVELLRRAAAQFGHFDAVLELGRMYDDGYVDVATNVTLVERNCAHAAMYLRAAAERGSWRHAMRAGFDSYLDGDVTGAALRYAAAAQLGFTIAASNAAFLLHYRQSSLRSLPSLDSIAREGGGGGAVRVGRRSGENGLSVAAARYYTFASRSGDCEDCEMHVAKLQLAQLSKSIAMVGTAAAADDSNRPLRVRAALAAAEMGYSAASSRGVAEASFSLAKMTEAGMAGEALRRGGDDDAADASAAQLYALAASQRDAKEKGRRGGATLESLATAAVVWSANVQLRLRGWLREQGYDDAVSALLQPRAFGGINAAALNAERLAVQQQRGELGEQQQQQQRCDAGEGSEGAAYTDEDIVLSALVGSLITLVLTVLARRICVCC